MIVAKLVYGFFDEADHEYVRGLSKNYQLIGWSETEKKSSCQLASRKMHAPYFGYIYRMRIASLASYSVWIWSSKHHIDPQTSSDNSQYTKSIYL